MPFFIPALIAGASALAGVLGNRAKKQTQTSESTSTFDNLTRPEYGEKESLVKDRILNELLARSEADTDLSGYSALGLGNIAKGQTAKQRSLASFLQSRGLGSSPMAAHAMAGLEGERIGSQVDFLNQLPLLKRDLSRQSLGDLSSFFSSLPVATRSTGTQTQKGTQTSQTPGNMLAGGLGSGMSALAGLYGMGAFSKGAGNPGGNFPGPIQGPTSEYDYDQPDWSTGYNPGTQGSELPIPGAYNSGRASSPWLTGRAPNNSFDWTKNYWG